MKKALLVFVVPNAQGVLEVRVTHPYGSFKLKLQNLIHTILNSELKHHTHFYLSLLFI